MLIEHKGKEMENGYKIEKTVEISFTEDELVKFICDMIQNLQDDEKWELINCYQTLGQFTFKIVKKNIADNN